MAQNLSLKSIPSNQNTHIPKSPRRKHTERVAIKHLKDGTVLRGHARLRAIEEVRAARSPMVAAKGIISKLTKASSGRGGLDLSDVQEIRVRIIRKHQILDTPQAMMCQRLDRMVLKGCTRREFDRVAKIALNMPLAFPKHLAEAENPHYASPASKAPPSQRTFVDLRAYSGAIGAKP